MINLSVNLIMAVSGSASDLPNDDTKNKLIRASARPQSCLQEINV